MWETLRYQGNDYAVEAELLTMAVAPDLRRRGLGLDFGTRSSGPSRDVVPMRCKSWPIRPTEWTMDTYRWMGLTEVGQVEVHWGEGSEVLVWWASASLS